MAGNFEFAYNLDGTNNPPAIHEFPVAATQTLVKGDLVALDTGKVAEAGASTASVLGVMAEASSGATAGTMVKVEVIQPGQVWKATADADATTHVLAAKTYDINATTQTVDVGDASNGCILILRTVDSTTDVRVMFTAFDLA